MSKVEEGPTKQNEESANRKVDMTGSSDFNLEEFLKLDTIPGLLTVTNPYILILTHAIKLNLFFLSSCLRLGCLFILEAHLSLSYACIRYSCCVLAELSSVSPTVIHLIYLSLSERRSRRGHVGRKSLQPLLPS